MTAKVPSSHSVCFCTTWEKQKKQNIEMNKKRQ